MLLVERLELVRAESVAFGSVPDVGRGRGGSNGSWLRLWKWEVQRLADETGLTMTIRHYPPGASKRNKIEHLLFACISQNRRG